ncbi:MAG: hypothetical protein IJ849_09890 [Selenomonadaceae bacterium]|nr:hypothetical protein [Selenomonadaceae bacterium]
MDNKSVADWLPWGGLTQPCVMENKDDSFIGVLSYTPNPSRERIVLPPMKNGWAIWSEEQSWPGVGRQHFLALSWNPFREGERITNALGKKSIAATHGRAVFNETLEEFKKAVGVAAPCYLLEYQELINYFSYAISLGEQQIVMPEVPLYLDALLSQDLDIDFTGNYVLIKNKAVFILTLPAGAEEEQREVIGRALQKFPYRSVRRLLLFSPEKAEEAMAAYEATWCKGRKSVKKLINEGLIGELSGYYTDSYILLVSPEKMKSVAEYIDGLMEIMELPYVIEDYNRKDVWWGSLPGMFRANVMPPLTGFSDLHGLMFHTKEKKEAIDVVSARPVQTEEGFIEGQSAFWQDKGGLIAG